MALLPDQKLLLFFFFLNLKYIFCSLCHTPELSGRRTMLVEMRRFYPHRYAGQLIYCVNAPEPNTTS